QDDIDYINEFDNLPPDLTEEELIARIHEATGDAAEVIMAIASSLAPVPKVGLLKYARNLYKANKAIVAAKSSNTVFRSFTKSNFRTNLGRLTGKVPANSQAHHVFPQKFGTQFSKRGINIHDPKFGTWWETSSHLKNARGYNAAWESFLSTNPNQSQILNYGRQLMGQYGIPVGF
ncbi:MAG: DUF2380 domain-containing protein, partial [Bacteroidota bacterium]